MDVCRACGQRFREGTRFCTGCGEPVGSTSSAPPYQQPAATPRRTRNQTAMWVAVAGLVAAVVGLTVLLVLRLSTAQPGPTLTGPVAQQPARVTPGGTSLVTPTTQGATEADLQRQVDADRDAAEGLVGNWVPQLSSKRLGLTVHGVTFDYSAILADFQALRARFPQSVLIRSDDYTSYQSPGYWVTVLAQTFPSADDANAWCDANGFAVEDCFAHRLSHTEGPAGSSKLR